MKRILYLSLLVWSLSAMHDNVVIIKDGDKESAQEYRVPGHEAIVAIETSEHMLDSDREQAYLTALCGVLRDLEYGTLDLRQLEETIAQANGRENSCFKHTWHPCTSEKTRAESVSIELQFNRSQKRVKSPYHLACLPHGSKLDLLTNLKNHAAAFEFAAGLFNPSKNDAQEYCVDISGLQEAVLTELYNISGE